MEEVYLAFLKEERDDRPAKEEWGWGWGEDERLLRDKSTKKEREIRERGPEKQKQKQKKNRIARIRGQLLSDMYVAVWGLILFSYSSHQ